MEWSTTSSRSNKCGFFGRWMVDDIFCKGELQVHNRTVNEVYIKSTNHLRHSTVQAWVVFLGDVVLS